MQEPEKELFRLLSLIRPADRKAMAAAKRRWNSVAKPIGSLGILEENMIRIAGMRGDSRDVSVRKSALAVMCADHGVVAEGVSQTGQEVTRIVAENFTKDFTCTTIMCHQTKTDVFPVDIGILGSVPAVLEPAPYRLLGRKVACGSKNIVHEAAMSRKECMQALLAGISLTGDLKEMGYEIVATGEMGIGNTTPSSAMAAVLTGLSAEEVTGRGAGLSDEGLLKKKTAVSRAVERFYEEYRECAEALTCGGSLGGEVSGSREAALTLLTELGGLDIAGIVGLFLGGAVYRIPMVIDGVISSVAALLAVRICSDVKDYLLASHVSSEPAGKKIMEALGLHAPLDCRMHLGEGSGAIALLPLLSMGAEVYEKMGTFGDIQVESYVDYESEKKAALGDGLR